jgi:hypothetical protein
MAATPSHDAIGFHNFLGSLLAERPEQLSPERALAMWREKVPDPEQYEDDVEAVREALADIEAGDTGVPWEEFKRDFFMQNFPDHRA